VPPETPVPAPPSALRSRNPLRWFSIFGPGAVIASLTIGSGELIFSSRGGAIFGYRLLFVFLVVLALKWALVLGTARHIVLTGVHPFERWRALPGPAGWLPLTFLLLAVVSFPVWVGFHAGTTGTLISSLAGTQDGLRGGAHFAWGLALLALAMTLVSLGGYGSLEKIQLAIVVAMLACVVVSFLVLKPEWLELVRGFLIPQPLAYPDWIATRPEFLRRPVWVEVSTYVGVIGGGGYDYLAYTSYLRDKHWGRAGAGPASSAELGEISARPNDALRLWLRAPLIDCTLSFIAVLVFTAVFVASGKMVLAPQHLVPSGANLLTLQAQFVEAAGNWLKPLYFTGAFLTMFGTLYGTIEVAPPTFREALRGLDPALTELVGQRVRRWSTWWCGLGGALVLLFALAWQLSRGGEAPALVAIVTPANLFTGVTACGLVCALSLWMDQRFLPRGLRMRWPLAVLNAVAAVAFVGLGAKGFWDHAQQHGRWATVGILLGTVALGWAGAKWLETRRLRRS
jgi:hypothetical protein